jgi:hypothetical protein
MKRSIRSAGRFHQVGSRRFLPHVAPLALAFSVAAGCVGAPETSDVVEQAQSAPEQPPPQPLECPPPVVPPGELYPPFFVTQLAKDVTRAVSWARNEAPYKSKNWALAIPGVRVANSTKLTSAVHDFVLRVAHVNRLRDDLQPCGQGNASPCAEWFQNAVFHNDGTLGSALYKAAKDVDGPVPAPGQPPSEQFKTVQLNTVVPLYDDQSAAKTVIVTASIKNGWLMGVAYLDRYYCGLQYPDPPPAAVSHVSP